MQTLACDALIKIHWSGIATAFHGLPISPFFERPYQVATNLPNRKVLEPAALANCAPLKPSAIRIWVSCRS